MPYITKARREAVLRGPTLRRDGHMLTPGELNFLISNLLNEYWRAPGRPQNYQTINDILGALEGAKAEFYRRVAVPYENAKMAENGDVYL